VGVGPGTGTCGWRAGANDVRRVWCVGHCAMRLAGEVGPLGACDTLLHAWGGGRRAAKRMSVVVALRGTAGFI